jgi:hypothetical protein
MPFWGLAVFFRGSHMVILFRNIACFQKANGSIDNIISLLFKTINIIRQEAGLLCSRNFPAIDGQSPSGL